MRVWLWTRSAWNIAAKLLTVAVLVALAVDLPVTAAIAGPAKVSARLDYAGGRDDSGWISFEYFTGNRIFLPVTVNGRSAMALLDSGATSTTIDRQFAAIAGIYGQGAVRGQGIGGADTITPADHVTITAGRMTVGGMSVFLMDDTAIAKSIGHAMPLVLGGEVFHDAVVDIDFAHHRLAFRRPSTFRAPPDAEALPLTTVGEIRTVPMEIEGRTLRMQFDLGNGGAILLYPAYWKAAGYPGDHRASTMLSGGMGGSHVQDAISLRDVRLGSTDFHDVPATLLNDYSGSDTDKFDGNVGIAILGRFHLFVDFPDRRLLLAPPIDTTTPFRTNTTGLTLRLEGDAMAVSYIAPGSPAATIGLKVDDRITAVEDLRSHARLTLNSPWTALPAGHVIRLHLRDGRILTLATARYY